MKKIFFVLFLQIPVVVSGQYTSLIDYGEDLASKGNYKKAIVMYQKALGEGLSRYETSLVYYRLGYCYADILDFDKAVNSFVLSYKFDKKDKEILYIISRLLHRIGQFDEAYSYLKKYRNSGGDKIKSEFHQQSLDFTVKCSNEPQTNQVRRNDELSSPFYDFSPCLLDNSTMIFTSSRRFKDSVEAVGRWTNIFFAHKEDKKWSIPVPVDTSINKGNNAGVTTIDNLRKVIFFSKCKDYECAIYYSFLQGDLLGEAIRINFDLPPQQDRVICHPSFSNSLNILFFSATLEGGYGGADIWMSKYDPIMDSWSKPENPGSGINTAGNELFPFINEDGTLYYSSDGGITLGGLDIMRAPMVEQLEWKSGENMKPPINSAGDDFGIVFESPSTGYFSSDRVGSLGRDDIYEFTLKDQVVNEAEVDTNTAHNDQYDFQTIYHLFNKEDCDMNGDKLSVGSIKLYPNPNDGNFTLEFNSNKEVQLNLRIHNNFGQLISNETLSASQAVSVKRFDIHSFPAGIYYLQILYGCEVLHVEKIIKN